jgi:plastocyanin
VRSWVFRGLRIASALAAGLVAVGVPTVSLDAQSVLERSPNLHGVWGVETGRGIFLFAHRFEVSSGGDELTSIPTLTLAAGLPLGLTAGVDYTSFSEAVPENLSGNEAQFWLKRPVRLTEMFDAALLAGYNTAARSMDGALDVRVSTRRISIFGEGRAFSDLFGSGDPGAAAAVGAAVMLTQHLAVTGDVGMVLTEEDVPAAWSAAVAMDIPGSPHTISFQLTNTGATTLQGASREKSVGSEDLRYGFAFTVPISPPSAWARIFQPLAPPPAPTTPGAVLVRISQFAYSPSEITIRQGQTIEWVNQDPDAHTATADGRSWDSGLLQDGERYSRTFTTPGRFQYFCIPHPQMTATVVVTP